MDKMRSKLEDLKELRDLVRSLGRGGGWGPLRRAPIQYLDMKVPFLPSRDLKYIGFLHFYAVSPSRPSGHRYTAASSESISLLWPKHYLVCVLLLLSTACHQFDHSLVIASVIRAHCNAGATWPAAHSAGSAGDQGPDTQR